MRSSTWQWRNHGASSVTIWHLTTNRSRTHLTRCSVTWTSSATWASFRHCLWTPWSSSKSPSDGPNGIESPRIPPRSSPALRPRWWWWWCCGCARWQRSFCKAVTPNLHYLARCVPASTSPSNLMPVAFLTRADWKVFATVGTVVLWMQTNVLQICTDLLNWQFL